MNTPQMHSDANGKTPRACDHCQTVFTPKRAWARFCSPGCRNEHHAEARRREAMREAAPDLYEALLKFVTAEEGWLKEKSGMPAGTFDDPLGDALKVAKVALAKAGYREPKPEKTAQA